VASGKSVATLAARARIRELEEGADWLANRGSRQRERKESSVTREIIDLSIRYALISRETSFVAVERRETPVVGDMQLRRVPIALTSGWGGIEQRPPVRATMTLGALAPMRDQMEPRSSMGAPSSMPMERARLESAAGAFAARFVGPLFRRKAKESSNSIGPSSAMHALVALQRADGHWELTEELANILEHELSNIERARQSVFGNQADSDRLWATALAITWLELRAADSNEEWRLLSIKARKWIDRVGPVSPQGQSWIDAARRFLTR